MMTKNEERQTLAKIKKLIEAAGADSYIGMAFAGCVDMAYENIENDWGCSYPDMMQSANKQIIEHSNRNRELEAELDSVYVENKSLQEEVKQLKQQLNAEKKKQIPADLYRDLWLTVEAQESEAKTQIAQIAEVLSYTETISETGTQSYINALRENRIRRDSAARLLAQLEKYEPKNI